MVSTSFRQCTFLTEHQSGRGRSLSEWQEKMSSEIKERGEEGAAGFELPGESDGTGGA